MDINKKNLIQVLEEQNNPGYEDDEQENNNKEGDFEEEFDDNSKKDHKMGKTQAKLARREAQKDIAKGRSTDLLRLEKNYFDGIYHEDNYQGMNEFVVKKLDGKSEIQKQKPLIGFYDKSDGILMFIVDLMEF